MQEMKVVINLREGRCTIGVSSPDCDPVFATMEGDLDAALASVPGMVQEAQAKWTENPQNPKADMPAPPPQPQRTATPTRQARPAQQSPQQSLF